MILCRGLLPGSLGPKEGLSHPWFHAQRGQQGGVSLLNSVPPCSRA